MYRIKRVKTPTDPKTGQPQVARDKTPLPARTHWARAAAAKGNVTEWVADKSLAGVFDEAAAEAVEAFYKDCPRGGVVTAEDA